VKRVLWRGVLPFAFFFAWACVHTLPLIFNLSSRLPGDVKGDYFGFLWNLWWARQSAQSGASFFFSPLLFAPVGFNLTLHAHTALQGYLAAHWPLSGLSLPAAQNVIILLTLSLNGFCAYLLARDRVEHNGAALLAGAVFATSPYVEAHLLGHYNLISVWCIPLILWCVTRALDRQSRGWSLVTGLAFIAVALADYYYLIYSGLLASAAVISGTGLIDVTCQPRPFGRGTRAGVISLLTLLIALSVVIQTTGGVDQTILGVRVRATEPGNLVTAIWLIALAALWVRLRPRVAFDPARGRQVLVSRLELLLPGTMVFVAGMTPLLIGAISLWRAGDYTAPEHVWRSGPRGVDLLTVALGNPLHAWAGGWIRELYHRLGINPVEQVGWLGLVPLLCLGIGLRVRRRMPELRRPLLAGIVFFIWALGPWLEVAGLRTGLLLPANFFGLVPLLSNARMPGRAIVVTLIAAAVIGARLVDRLPAGRRTLMCVLAIGVIAADDFAVPFPTTSIETPALYQQLKTSPPGTVLELPMGWRDGFEEAGQFDDRTLLYQTIHEHPLVGGFAARTSPRVKQFYEQAPVLSILLRCSRREGCSSEEVRILTPATSELALSAAGIQYVVVDRARTSPQLSAIVATLLPLTLVASEGERYLYRVTAEMR
jgi:hypothetical protein